MISRTFVAGSRVGVVGLLLVGVGVPLTWGAPLLAGGVTVALLALVNIAPYAADPPRWVPFGAAGVVLPAWCCRRGAAGVALPARRC